MEAALEPYRKAHKYMDDMLLRYVKSLNIPVGTNVLNARNHVESAKEEQKKEDNEEQVEEEWSSYPSSIPNNGNAQIPMNTPSYTIASNDDLYSDEPILDESFDVNAFYGNSYDSWVEKIFVKDKNDSISTSPPIKNEDEEYCFDLLNDSVIDDDPLLPDSPLCGTIVSNIWEDESDINELDDPLCSLDDNSLWGDSSENYTVVFSSNACKYYKRGRDKSPLYVSTLFKMQATDHYMYWLLQSCCYLFMYKMPMHRKRVRLKS